jgi:hypothetical protein
MPIEKIALPQTMFRISHYASNPRNPKQTPYAMLKSQLNHHQLRLTLPLPI